MKAIQKWAVPSVLTLAPVLSVGMAMASSSVASVLNSVSPYYAGVSFGKYFTDSDRAVNSPSTAGLFAGYRFNKTLSAQITALFMPTQVESTGQNNSGYFVGAEGVVNLPTLNHFQPFITVGAGVLKITSDSTALDFGVGVRYNLVKNFAVQANFRHFVQLNQGYNDNYLSAGLVWSFGNPTAMPGQTKQPNWAPKTAPIVKLTSSQKNMLKAAKKQLKPYLPEGVYRCGHHGATPLNGCVSFKNNQMIMHLDVKFLQAKANIRGKFAPAIERLGQFMVHYPTTKATLYGYASSEGVLKFNKKLSNWRAESVKAYLVNHNQINPSRISTVGKGIQDPIASNKTLKGRELNRRVQAAVGVKLKLNK